jgi:transcriptional regulator with XRE-family HTH domain
LQKSDKSGTLSSLMAYAAQMTELSLGRRIRIARLDAELSIGELARRLDRRRETVSAWEHDHQEPKASDLARLVELLNVRADWVLFGETRAFRSGQRPRSPIRPELDLIRGTGHGSLVVAKA